MTTSLAGKAILVTGASSGIGRAVALKLARAGAGLLLTGRDSVRLHTLADQIRRSGADPRLYVADLRLQGDLVQLATSVRRDAPELDGLVHCAGLIELGTVIESEQDALERQLEVNLKAPVELTRQLLPALTSAPGQVVFINSTAAVSPAGGSYAYAASKAALRAFADSLRQEVNDDGIRVLSLILGRTATPMQEAIHQREGLKYQPERLVQPEDVADLVVAALALSPTAEVTEIRLRPARKPQPSRQP